MEHTTVLPGIVARESGGGNCFDRFADGAAVASSHGRFVDAAAVGDGVALVGEERAAAAASSFAWYFWA